MKATPLTQKPSFPLMKQGDIQNVYHLEMPRWLFTGPRYMGLALETKVAYTFLLNRFQLSRLNGWVNEDGAVFIIYTRRSLAEEMQVSYRKIIEVRSAGMALPEVSKLHPSQKERNYTNLIHTEISPSVYRETGRTDMTQLKENTASGKLFDLGKRVFSSLVRLCRRNYSEFAKRYPAP